MIRLPRRKCHCHRGDSSQVGIVNYDAADSGPDGLSECVRNLDLISGLELMHRRGVSCYDVGLALQCTLIDGHRPRASTEIGASRDVDVAPDHEGRGGRFGGSGED